MEAVNFAADGDVYATSAHVGARSKTRYSPDRAFFPSRFPFGKQFWQSSSSSSSSSNDQSPFPQIIYFRFRDEPRAVVTVSFDACTADSRGCETRTVRESTGPRDFDVVAALDCDNYGEDADWIVVAEERGKRWTGDSAVTIVVKGEARYRCWGIRILAVGGVSDDGIGSGASEVFARRATVAHVKMHVIRCDALETNEMTREWDCEKGDNGLGDTCKPICEAGYTGVGVKSCERY